MLSRFISRSDASALSLGGQLVPAKVLPTYWAAVNGEMSSGRFRLYVSYACPWSHRVLIARALRGLHDIVEVVDVEPEMDAIGWRLEGGHLADRYHAHAPNYVGKATVPLMIDTASGQAVSNQSAVLMRMLGTMIAGAGHPLFSLVHAKACGTWNRDIDANVNAVVYRGGIVASGQDRCRKTHALAETMTTLDRHLADHRHLVDQDEALEPDWRLWTTLGRYDIAYRPLMLSPDALPLAAFPNLARFFAELLAVPGIAATYRPGDIVTHYSARVRDLTIDFPHSSNGDQT